MKRSARKKYSTGKRNKEVEVKGKVLEEVCERANTDVGFGSEEEVGRR